MCRQVCRVALAALLGPAPALAQDPSPSIPVWASKGMVAALSRPMEADKGVVIEALRFPLAVEMIPAAEMPGHAELVNNLRAVLADRGSRTDTVITVEKALGRIDLGNQAEAVVKALLDRREDSDDDVRDAAEDVLQSIHSRNPEAIVKAFLDRLADGTPKVRAAAAGALAEIGPASQTEIVVKALLELLADKTPSVKTAAAGALAQIGPGNQTEAVVKALLDRLTDSDPGVLAAVADALGKIGTGNQTEAVVKAFLRLAGRNFQLSQFEDDQASTP
jgi:HEAT repeat protein